MRIYGVTGGITFYIGSLDPKKDLYTKLEQSVFSKESVLYAEGELLLLEELREPAT
jgi:hypothetical protein